MSQSFRQDLEAENNPNGHHDPPNQQKESRFVDSSGKLFSIYSSVAEAEDDKMVERWQNDANGILIFTGLFSAAVAALLAVTVQDLRPNIQDTSVFYLGNIYGILADPNATRASLPSPVAKPPPFSRPRYSVWVNSLWFLSLVMSLSCALWATSLQQWARRYIRLTQPARRRPEKRARMRAFFANGVEKMHTPWAVEGLPALLHLSLFLFFGGLAIFLFNVNHEVFICVVSWIGLFSAVYVLITMLPLIRLDSPYYTPLSIPAWFPYATIHYAIFAFLRPRFETAEDVKRYLELRGRYRGWISWGMEKTAEKTAEERSLKIDTGILDWTISALDDDDSLEELVEAIPGFLKSELVGDLIEQLPDDVSRRLSRALGEFWSRTLSSNSVIDKVKTHRLDISLDAINSLPDVNGVSSALSLILFNFWDQVPKTVELGNTVARWYTGNDGGTTGYAQRIVVKVLWAVRERDDRWFKLADRVCGLPECALRDVLTHGDDSGSLALLIHLTRRALRSDNHWGILGDFTQIDIRNTQSGLQLDFCTLWNEMVQEAMKQGSTGLPLSILREIRRHYIALHQGTNSAPTAFSSSTGDYSHILLKPSSYPLCKIASLAQNATLLRLRTRGLVNTGGMCFANAILQLLVHSPSFWNLFREQGGLKGRRGVGSPETGGGAIPLVDATVRFLEEFVFKEPPPSHQAAGEKEDEDLMKGYSTVDSFEPMYMYDVMKEKRRLKSLLDGQQQDAEEFFRLYLDSLDEELLTLPASIKGHKSAAAALGVEEREVSQSGQTDVGRQSSRVESIESPLMRIFGGKFRSTMRALNQPDTVTIEDWRSLQLDIQHDSVHTIDDALARISHLQPVQLGPSGSSEASQQVFIEALPPVLVLHLKRFLYDVNADGIVKITKPIQFAPELEIPLEMMAPVAGTSAEPVHYKPYGVLYHHGGSADSGHYSVDVLHSNGESGNGEAWLRIDDESVSVVRHDDVFGGHDNDRCVSMLFYCRTAPP